MNIIEDAVRRNMVRFLVQKAIFCPWSGEVLDYRTCVVMVDTDGDPVAVMSQSAWTQILSIMEQNNLTMEQAFPLGHRVDPTTVK